MKHSPAIRSGARWRTLLRAGALCLVLMVAAIVLISATVVQDDTLRRADLIYVLNGRIESRAHHTARVYAAGVAPAVRLALTREAIPARSNRPARTLSELMAAEIVALGVPAGAVEIVPFPNGVVNTRDEGRALRAYLEARAARVVIVVTSDYHTGRAKRTLRHELRGLDVEIVMAAAPGPAGITPMNWWSRGEGIQRYLTEFARNIGAMGQNALD